MRTVLTLLFVQGCLGALHTLWYHEFRLHLPRNPAARNELTLHSFPTWSMLWSSAPWHGQSGMASGSGFWLVY